MTIYDIPGIIKSVFPAAMTPLNIQAGFEELEYGHSTLRCFKIATLILQQLLIGQTQKMSLKGTKHLHIPRIPAQPNRLL